MPVFTYCTDALLSHRLVNQPMSLLIIIEILLIGSAPGTDLPSLLCVGQNNIPLSNASRNLGVIFDVASLH